MSRYIDAISKAEVLETYAELYDVFDDYKEIQKELHKVYDKLNALQTTDVAPLKNGRWEERIIDDELPLFKKRFYCSCCGRWTTYGKTEYCPHCGAKMENE